MSAGEATVKPAKRVLSTITFASDVLWYTIATSVQKGNLRLRHKGDHFRLARFRPRVVHAFALGARPFSSVAVEDGVVSFTLCHTVTGAFKTSMEVSVVRMEMSEGLVSQPPYGTRVHFIIQRNASRVEQDVL